MHSPLNLSSAPACDCTLREILDVASAGNRYVDFSERKSAPGWGRSHWGCSLKSSAYFGIWRPAQSPLSLGWCLTPAIRHMAQPNSFGAQSVSIKDFLYSYLLSWSRIVICYIPQSTRRGKLRKKIPSCLIVSCTFQKVWEWNPVFAFQSNCEVFVWVHGIQRLRKQRINQQISSDKEFSVSFLVAELWKSTPSRTQPNLSDIRLLTWRRSHQTNRTT